MRPCRLLSCLIIGLTVQTAKAGELYWYLAAAMTKPGQAVVDAYNATKPIRPVLMINGGSGQLLSKLRLARQGDLYTPASTVFLQQARDAGIVADARPLLTQTPVFGLSKAGATRVASFEDLGQPGLRLALGNPKTMALGITYQTIEQKMGRASAERLRANAVVEAINISQIVNYLKTGSVDAGLIFDSVARANRLPMIPIPAAYNLPETAYLVRLTFSIDPGATKALADFILQQAPVFEKFGFRLVTQP
jgi:molybdate transport system substrate-binding protein